MKPCSTDLRKRVVDAYLNREGTQIQIAKRFSIDRHSVRRWVAIYKKTGTYEHRPYAGGRPPKVMPEGNAFLKKTIEKIPDLTLAQLQDRYYRKFGVKISLDTVSKHLRALNFTLKKKRPMPKSSNEKKPKSTLPAS